MTVFAQTECCRLLGIDPKTLRSWLKQAELQFTAHPADARLKCLTDAQVQHLATLHHRPFACTSSPPPSAVPEADLCQEVLRLRVQVASLQEQLAQLALEVLRGREFHTEQRLGALETLVLPEASAPPSSPSSAEAPAGVVPALPSSAPLSPSRPAPVRTGSRAQALLAVTATGSYVLICREHGELPIVPDSPEWFDWLSTRSSFRFVGKRGRLSASRTKGRPCWMAYRRIHGHCYSYGLGNTKRLTIAHLEQMAATLQAHASSR
jgi:transposase-like protein